MDYMRGETKGGKVIVSAHFVVQQGVTGVS